MSPLHHYFLPYQVRWIRAPHPVIVAEKSRRIGWTYAASYRAVERRLTLGTDLFYSSADLSAAREFIEQCQRWARVFKTVAADLGESAIDEKTGISALVLRFQNGARIVAGSSNPKFFRGKGGDTDGDEFAFHQQPRELYKAMQPAALIWGHQMRLWSTHNGEGSFFNRLIQGIQRDAPAQACSGERSTVNRSAPLPTSTTPVLASSAPPALSASPATLTGQAVHTQRVTLVDAVSQGLVEKLRGLSQPDLTARRAFLEEVRATCIDEDAWNEEYLCTPSSEQSALLSYELIAACEIETPEQSARGAHESGADPRGVPGATCPIGLPPISARPASPLYAGFDVGRKHDRSALWVLEQIGDVFWTRAVHILKDTTFTAQEQSLDLLLRNRGIRRLCIDSTGIGAMLGERLSQRWGHRVEAIHFTTAVKADLALPLLRLFQDRLIRIPADAEIRQDLHKVRKGMTAAHHVRFDAARDAEGHADRFWALALAHHAAGEKSARLTTAPYKPAGW